jgi:multidrug resistance efflux pump
LISAKEQQDLDHKIFLPKRFSGIVVFFVLASMLAVGCGARETSTPTAEDLPTNENDFASVVSATGVVVPTKYATLSFSASGMVAEVLVSEGETVEAGQPLIRLTGGDSGNPLPELLAMIQTRQLEVDAAQQAIENLDKQANTLKIQAEQTLNAVISQIRDLQYRLQDLEVPEEQEALSAFDGYDLALEKYQLAADAFEPYKDEPTNNSERRDRLDRLEEAQENYDVAITRLQLVLALNAAESSRNQARLDLDKYKVGAPADEVQRAAKNLNAAEVRLQAAQASLESLTLTAPYSGTVSEVYARAGEWTAPGAPMVVLADLSELQIETTDMSEIDMIRIAVGDPVMISFDALPEASIPGRVVWIANKDSAGTGVNYRVIIAMDTDQPNLRWGMTAFVDIIAQDSAEGQ